MFINIIGLIKFVLNKALFTEFSIFVFDSSSIFRLGNLQFSILILLANICFWRVNFQALRKFIFQAPQFHYWDLMVECVNL